MVLSPRSGRRHAAHGEEAVKKSKQSLAKAPSRKGREAQVSCFLCDLCDLAPLREHVFALLKILSQLRSRGSTTGRLNFKKPSKRAASFRPWRASHGFATTNFPNQPRRGGIRHVPSPSTDIRCRPSRGSFRDLFSSLLVPWLSPWAK